MLGPESYNQYEVGLIGWCLRNGDEFGNLVRQVQHRYFTDMQAVTIWPYLMEVWNKHQQWPTQAEAIHILNQRLASNPLRPVYIDYLKACYSAPISEVTGEELRKWVVGREMLSLSSNLQQLATQISTLSPEEQSEKLEELKLNFDVSMRVLDSKEDEDEDYDPLAQDTIDNLNEEVDEEWGAPPLPTGFARLDSKIKDGGIRSYGVLVFGPTGGGKTTVVVNVVMYASSLGKRGVIFSLDDSRGDMRDRIHSHVLCEEIEYEVIKATGRLPEIQRRLAYEREHNFPGQVIIKSLDPERYTPADLIYKLDRVVEKLARVDAANGEPERAGKLDFVVVDTGDQIVAERRYHSEWYEVGKTHQTLNIIPKRFNCPMFVVVQGGAQTVGAAQLTERDIGEGYGKAKPYKLILGVAQTAAQYHDDRVLPLADGIIQDNLHNLHNYCLDTDRDTLWKPFTLCLIKNTRGRSKSGQANKVKLPMLIHYGSQRILENYLEPEGALTSPLQTSRDEVEATAGPTITRKRRKVKVG